MNIPEVIGRIPTEGPFFRRPPAHEAIWDMGIFDEQTGTFPNKHVIAIEHGVPFHGIKSLDLHTQGQLLGKSLAPGEEYPAADGTILIHGETDGLGH